MVPRRRYDSSVTVDHHFIVHCHDEDPDGRPHRVLTLRLCPRALTTAADSETGCQL